MWLQMGFPIRMGSTAYSARIGVKNLSWPLTGSLQTATIRTGTTCVGPLAEQVTKISAKKH